MPDTLNSLLLQGRTEKLVRSSISAITEAKSANTFIAKTKDGFGGAMALAFDLPGPLRVEGEFSINVVLFDRLSIDAVSLAFDNDKLFNIFKKARKS